MAVDGSAPELPGYSIRTVLGVGGFGTVYLAEQRGLGRDVALKVLHASLDGPVARRRFEREAQVLAGLNHPNLVRVFDFQDDGDLAYLALEYLTGGTLKDRIQRPAGASPGLPAAQALSLAKDLLAGLAALHAAGLVHRDVKPGNVLFRDTGQAVLGDLGLSRSTSPEATRLTRHGIVVGTIPYLAPEALAGAEQTASTDLFAAGVTLYEALAGRHPTDHRQFPVNFRPPDIATLRPDAPRGLCDLVRELMDPDAARRPASARELVPRLRSRAGASGKSRGIAIPPGPFRRRAHLALAAAALVAVGVAARWQSSPPPLVLDVQAGARQLLVRANGTQNALALSAYEPTRGRLVRAVTGAVADGSTSFKIEGLEPDTGYEVALTDGPPGPATPPLAQRATRTLGEVEVLGADDASRAVWMRCTPAASVGEPGSAAVRVDARGARVPLKRMDAEVELAFPSGARARLALEPAVRTARTTLPIALLVKSLDGTVRDGDRAVPLAEWLAAVRPAFVCVTARADGTPDLSPAIESLQRAHVPVALGVDPAAVTTATAWVARARALRASGAVSRFFVEPHRVRRMWERQTGHGTLTHARAQAWFGKEVGADLVVPTVMDRFGTIVYRYLRSWSPELGRVDALDREDCADLGMNRVLPAIREEARTLGAALDVKTLFNSGTVGLGPALTDRYDPVAVERAALARGLAFHLEDFPDAVVVYRLDDMQRAGALTGAWYTLERMAKSLAGTRFARRLGRTPPRLDGAPGVQALCFQGATHRVQVLTNLHGPVQATYTPAAPGSLHVLDPAPGALAAPRPLTTTAPVELKLGFPPVVHVEWAPVRARPVSGDAVELLPRTSR